MTEPAHVVIESRVQLFSSLGEAAELEHNLMCLYLYAALALKREVSEGVTEEQLVLVNARKRGNLRRPDLGTDARMRGNLRRVRGLG